MSRPEVDDSDPNVRERPESAASPATSSNGSMSTSLPAMNTEVNSASMVALHERLCAIHLQAGLHAGEPAEPDQIEVADREAAHCALVVTDGHVLDLHAELGGQVVGNQPELTLQDFRILIRYGADPERAGRVAVVVVTAGRQPNGHAAQKQKNQTSKEPAGADGPVDRSG